MSTSQPDANKAPAYRGPTAFKTERNTHEVHCGMCGATIYVDQGIYTFAQEGIQAGLDNPFKCENCEREYDDLSYEG